MQDAHSSARSAMMIWPKYSWTITASRFFQNFAPSVAPAKHCCQTSRNRRCAGRYIATQSVDYRIVTGTGFETRPYRISGGQWIEVDEPQVIAYKMTDCRFSIVSTRYSGSVSISKQNRFTKDCFPTRVTAKSLSSLKAFLYLNDYQIRVLLQNLRTLFPNHLLIGDVLTREFVQRYSRRFDKKDKCVGCVLPDERKPDTGFSRRAIPDNPENIDKCKECAIAGLSLPAMAVPLFLQNGCGRLQRFRTGYRQCQHAAAPRDDCLTIIQR